MKRILVFEERGGTDDKPSPAKLAADAATRYINEHNAQVLHMAVAIFVDHARGLEDYTLTLEVQVPERVLSSTRAVQREYEEMLPCPNL